MAQRTSSKRTLPKRERAFWRKVQKLVLPQLAGKVWFPSWWMSRTIPEGFKEFMLDRFASEMQSDEQSAHAWSMAVCEIVRYLVNCPEAQFQVLYDYPSCDGFPFLLVARKGRVLGLVSIYPVDYFEDGLGNWRELRDFLLRVADAVRAVLENQNLDSAEHESGEMHDTRTRIAYELKISQ
jgi:hypothetical protein